MAIECWLLGRSAAWFGMSSRTTTTGMNEMALPKKAAPGPRVARTSPARAGPPARATVNWMEFSRTAFIRSSRGTSEGTKACQDEMLTPPAMPLTRTISRIDQTAAWPDSQRPHRAKAETIMMDWHTSRT